MNEDLIEVFVAEGRELLDLASEALESLRRDAKDSLALERLFRAFHTLKGSAGLMGFAVMGELYHLAEDRLSEAREGSGAVGDQLAEDLLALVDTTEAWLDQCETQGRVPVVDEGSTSLLADRLGGGRRPMPRVADDQPRLGAMEVEGSADPTAGGGRRSPDCLVHRVAPVVSRS